MKKRIPAILLIILLCWISCDKIEPPYIEAGNQSAEKTILIEKFTGHKCSNCPEASRKVEELKDFYKDNLISVAIHPGALTEFTGIDENYPYDFTTNASDLIADDMGASFLPLGTVNRVAGGISNRCFTKDEWAQEIDKLLYDDDGNPLEKNIDFSISTSLNELNKELTIQTSVILLNNLETNYNLCLVIIEDGIISPQDDGSESIQDYEHNDIYRSAVNGVYGENITKFAFVSLEGQSGYQATHTLIFNEDANVNWTNDWNNINNCAVLAYVYDTETLVIEHVQKHHIMHE